MSRLIESIKLLDGKFYNLSLHEERMKRSLLALFNSSKPINLEHILTSHDYPVNGWFKCRIIYDSEIRDISFSPYTVRSVRSLRVIEDDDISYAFKFEDRTQIDKLFSMREGCDDVLIVRSGMVTDCSYSNIAFRKGDRWFTPDSPLLEGTARARLIRENKIEVKKIGMDDIRSFDSVRLVNALLEFDGPEIAVSDIVF